MVWNRRCHDCCHKKRINAATNGIDACTLLLNLGHIFFGCLILNLDVDFSLGVDIVGNLVVHSTFFDSALLQILFGEDRMNVATLINERFHLNLLWQETIIPHFDLCHQEHIEHWAAGHGGIEFSNQDIIPERIGQFTSLCMLQKFHSIVGLNPLDIIVESRLWRSRISSG